MDNIKVLFLTDDITKFQADYPDEIKVLTWNEKFLKAKDYIDILVIDRSITDEEADALFNITRAYTVFYLEEARLDNNTRRFISRRMGKAMNLEALKILISLKGKDYYQQPYGEKANPKDIGIAQGFDGTIKWNGQYSVELEGDYGPNFNQIVFWKYNIPVAKGQSLDLWLEYTKDDSVEVVLEIRKITSGSISDISNIWTYTEIEMQDEICIENNDDVDGTLFVSLNARGSGRLNVIALHDRHSRRGVGTFLVGGERYVTSEREEIFAYFDPGDMKPPLAVYFSGYKTQEGFEGYYMMRKMGCPFLLIAEQRFEGGGFYLGTPEYEKLMVDIIGKYLDALGFYPEQLILSGISMGTIGSLYYGCDFRPHALILGKPLASLGDIAANERLKRPAGFPTSLDLLHHYAGGMDTDSIDKLNDRVWSKIRATDFGHTKFIVSYMFEDDYDKTAYDKLLSELNSAGVQVYGKGLHGRHNDNTAGIGAWFKGQYDRILKDDFDR
ncbi:MAG: accessory Sec system protein Asp2 [Pseudobutyrivibrio sp.]|nr:accessory Sec system protein Asp2 [Pseudobutyrivibrio sp.]